MKSVRNLLIGLGVFLLAVIGISISTYSVKTNETAMVMRFGKVSYTVATQGLKFKVPFIDSVNIIYTGNNLYDIASSDVITSDKKSMIADNYVIWSVTDPVKYYQSLGAVQGRAEERIDAAVYNATKNIISSMTQDEILAARGDELTTMITKESNSDISQYGIEVVLAEIKALDLPEDNKEAVYERMISERSNIAAGYTAQGEAEAAKVKNETDKQVTVIKADAEKQAAVLESEGEAEYMRILADAYNDEDKADFYKYIIGLDALDALAESDNTLILDKNSEYAKILYGEE